MEEVGVAAFGERKLFEISVLLQEVGFGDMLRYLQGVGLDVGRDETELAGKAGGRLVDMGGDKESANAVHHLVQLVEVGIQGRPQQPFFLAYDLFVFVHDELVAEFLFVQGNMRKMFIEKYLELVELLVGLEIGQRMSLLLGGDFHTSDDQQAGFATQFLCHLDLSCGVVVTDGDDVEVQFLGLLHNGRRTHIDVAARRKHRVYMQVGSIGVEFHCLQALLGSYLMRL